jgi:hypothetical protein
MIGVAMGYALWVDMSLAAKLRGAAHIGGLSA